MNPKGLSVTRLLIDQEQLPILGGALIYGQEMAGVTCMRPIATIRRRSSSSPVTVAPA
jgi:hypothetical protein